MLIKLQRRHWDSQTWRDGASFNLSDKGNQLMEQREVEELSGSLWFSSVAPICTPLSAVSFSLSLPPPPVPPDCSHSRLLLIIPPSSPPPPRWGEDEGGKMGHRSALLNGHSRIMDKPITQTSRVVLCSWMTEVTAGRRGGEVKRGRDRGVTKGIKEGRWETERSSEWAGWSLGGETDNQPDLHYTRLISTRLQRPGEMRTIFPEMEGKWYIPLYAYYSSGNLPLTCNIKEWLLNKLVHD